MGSATINLVVNELRIEGYERVVEFKEPAVGLHAIIAIHNTKLGPALGGIRAFPYSSFQEGLNDVLRLSKGMTYKASVAQTGTGGGKSVIFTDYRIPKRKELLLAFSEAVNFFQGEYICAEDFGMHLSDLETVCQGTSYAVGLPANKSCGDPSPFTAFGGFCGIRAICKQLLGDASPIKRRTFAIQGLGSVGMRIAEHLFWAGARLIVADIDEKAISKAVKNFHAKVVSPEEILSTECDVLVPCALGGIINAETVPELKCAAVAGLANNQLQTEEDGAALFERGILYAPDYVINAGGLLAVCVELFPEGFNPFVARTHVERIENAITEIVTLSDVKNLPTNLIANHIAEGNLEREIGKRTQPPVFQG